MPWIPQLINNLIKIQEKCTYVYVKDKLKCDIHIWYP